MATKKKAKTKAKKKKTPAPKTAARKKAAPKKAAVKKKPAAKAKAKPASARKPAPAVAAPPPGMERIGIVTHYYNHLSVAILKLESGNLRVGDVIHIRGHTSDFPQQVESLEIDHVHVNEVRPGQSFGLRVKEHTREHDVVYKAKA